MEIENIARISFASRGAAEQERNFAIGNGVFGQIIINNQDILAFIQKYSAMAQPA